MRSFQIKLCGRTYNIPENTTSSGATFSMSVHCRNGIYAVEEQRRARMTMTLLGYVCLGESPSRVKVHWKLHTNQPLHHWIGKYREIRCGIRCCGRTKKSNDYGYFCLFIPTIWKIQLIVIIVQVVMFEGVNFRGTKFELEIHLCGFFLSRF